MQITASAVSLNVEDVAASSNFLTELARLRAEGVAITMPLTIEQWGERLFQVTDPNGVIVQLMDWAGRPGSQAPDATAQAGPARSTP